MKKSITLLFTCMAFVALTAFAVQKQHVKQPVDQNYVSVKDTLPEKEVKLKAFKANVMATYYADKFNGRKTSSGQRFDNKKLTAAHRSLPFGTKVRVTNPTNGKWVDVTVNDRGPFTKKLEIDLTRTAFTKIAHKKGAGTMKVHIDIIEK